jgi:uncharacterized membrane protein YeaQ/YmgE (transglycosylase-associated protein family)
MWLVLGLAVGWLAPTYLGRPGTAMAADVITGMVGAVIGGAIGSVLLRADVLGFTLAASAIAAVAAGVLGPSGASRCGAARPDGPREGEPSRLGVGPGRRSPRCPGRRRAGRGIRLGLGGGASDESDAARAPVPRRE